MSLKRKYRLNMPQLLWGGLSENWLLKELGDVHWHQITDAFNTASDQLVDSRGERLYASFVRLKWSGDNIAEFSENDEIDVNSKLSRYGSKMFFSETSCIGTSGKLKASLMSVFSTREASDNTQLKKGTLKAEITSDKIKIHKRLPALAKEYLDKKVVLFDEKGALKPEAYLRILYRKEYRIDAYDDINGVGLLYFASYPKISDKCERDYVHFHYKLKKDWLDAAGVIFRDIHYYGNANPGENLIYELNELENVKGKVSIKSSLYRAADMQLIARISVVKQLAEGIVLRKRKNPIQESLPNADMYSDVFNKTPVKQKENLSKAPALDKDTLSGIVIKFIESMLEVKGLSSKSDLNALGIESIVYQELSEFLFEKYQIDSNPSLFFGASTIEDLTDYLLGIDKTSGASLQDNPKTYASRNEVAVIGMSGRFPGAENVREFWRQIADNKDLISEAPSERWDWKAFNSKNDKAIPKWGGFIQDVTKFDPLFFGISPREAELMDPQQRITLEAVYAALEDAAIKTHNLKGTNTGVYLGVSGSDYAHLLSGTRKKAVEAYDTIGTSTSILVNRISYLLDIHGPSQAIDTACSSSLVALHEAVKSIESGLCEMAFAGGVHTMFRPEVTMSYGQAGMLSEDGRCKTFDERANGYVRGEGVGVVLLKSLESAKRDGDPIYAVIKGSSVNHGGKANTLTSPNPKAQKALIVQAYKKANISPEKVTYIEAHGTGTPLGDPIEIEGLKLAFSELFEAQNISNPVKEYCGIGSVKTNIGHLEAAAGIAGFIKLLLCLQHKMLPGNPHLKSVNKYINLENSPFYLRKETSEWEVPNKHPRTASISSFGFGGVNAHAVVQEYTTGVTAYKGNHPAVITLSAKNENRLRDRASDLAEYITQFPECNLHHLAYTLQTGRDEMEERLALVVTEKEELVKKLNDFVSGSKIGFSLGSTKKGISDFKMDDEAGKTYLKAVIKEKNYKSLAQLWTRGVQIDWKLLYQKQKPSKLRLPTYPFERKKYWSPEINVSQKSDDTVQYDQTKTDTEKNISVRATEPKPTGVDVKTFLVTLLGNVLKLTKEDIDLSADISDYGIDSIMSSQLISELRDIVPEIPQLLFLEYRTFNDIIEYLESNFSKNFQSPAADLIQEESPDTLAHMVLESQERLPETLTAPVPENESAQSMPGNDLAIIGISGILPQSENITDFLNHLEKGNTMTSSVPQKRMDLLRLDEEEQRKTANCYGGFIDGIENFDYEKFKFSREEALQMDPQLRKLIESVWLAIGDSGYQVKEFQKRETGVFVATRGHSGYTDVMHRSNMDYEVEFPALYANRLSHVFNLKGPSEIIDTGCSAFIAALERASHAFERGDCEQAIVSTATMNLSYQELNKKDLTGVLSKQNKTRSFDEDADGFVRSETIGTMILKPLRNAEEDGDYVYGIIKGIGVYHGGKSPLKWNSPNIKGQKKAIEKAIKQANINPLTIDYIEAEANGMSFVDSSEMVSIQAVYGDYFKESVNGWKDKTIFIGSLKPLVGHAETSSTFPCLLKLILSTRKKRLFGIKGLNKVNAAISIKDNFSILREDCHWPEVNNTANHNHPKRMAINCLGIGGVNTHLIFEEYKNKPSDTTKSNGFNFCFSDESEQQLSAMLQTLADQLPRLGAGMTELELLNRLEFTMLEGRKPLTYRLLIQADTLDDLIRGIRLWHEKKNTYQKNDTVFYNFGKLQTTDSEQLTKALENKNWDALFHLWLNGAVINWKQTNYITGGKRIPVPTQTLKLLYCWPFETEVPAQHSQKDQMESTPVVWSAINGQKESPYSIEDNHLFLFEVHWKESPVREKETVNSDRAYHTVICYLDESVTYNFKDTTNFRVISKARSFSGTSFIKLAQTAFQYLRDLLAQKPKHEIGVQMVFPSSMINTCYGLIGLVYTCRYESSKVKPQLIFVEENTTHEKLQEIMLENRNTLREDYVVKYEDDKRFTECFVNSKFFSTPINLSDTYSEGDVILITGGLGGLGLMVAKDILKQSENATIVLTGRSELTESKQKIVEKLNGGTSQVVYYASDIANKTNTGRLIREIVKTHGKLDGIIHCAGVIRDNYLVNKTVNEIQTVLAPKILGAENLNFHTKKLPLKFFLCFSSLHSYGNAGQADYAMANAYLDGFVRERNIAVASGKQHGITMSMNWPYWEEGGMQLSEDALELMKEIKGSVPLPTALGMYIMHYALQQKSEQLIIDFGDLEKISRKHNFQSESVYENIE